MTEGRIDETSRSLTRDLREVSGERLRSLSPPALVADEAGGDPIVYDDERDESSYGLQQQRP